MKHNKLALAFLTVVASAACASQALAGDSDRRYFHSPVTLGGKTGVTYTQSANAPTIGLLSRSSGVGDAQGTRGAGPAPERRYSHSPIPAHGKTGVTVSYGR